MRAGFALSQAYSKDEPEPEADADFEPSLTNTVLFLLSTAMLLTTFGVNYTGRPYMASLTSNKGLAITLLSAGSLIILLTSGALPSLEEYLELKPLPGADAMRSKGEEAAGESEASGAGLGSDLLNLMLVDFAVCLAVEKGTSRLFSY